MLWLAFNHDECMFYATGIQYVTHVLIHQIIIVSGGSSPA
jgi:hypothetical protein